MNTWQDATRQNQQEIRASLPLIERCPPAPVVSLAPRLFTVVLAMGLFCRSHNRRGRSPLYLHLHLKRDHRGPCLRKVGGDLSVRVLPARYVISEAASLWMPPAWRECSRDCRTRSSSQGRAPCPVRKHCHSMVSHASPSSVRQAWRG